MSIHCNNFSLPTPESLHQATTPTTGSDLTLAFNREDLMDSTWLIAVPRACVLSSLPAFSPQVSNMARNKGQIVVWEGRTGCKVRDQIWLVQSLLSQAFGAVFVLLTATLGVHSYLQMCSGTNKSKTVTRNTYHFRTTSSH